MSGFDLPVPVDPTSNVPENAAREPLDKGVLFDGEDEKSIDTLYAMLQASADQMRYMQYTDLGAALEQYEAEVLQGYQMAYENMAGKNITENGYATLLGQSLGATFTEETAAYMLNALHSSDVLSYEDHVRVEDSMREIVGLLEMNRADGMSEQVVWQRKVVASHLGENARKLAAEGAQRSALFVSGLTCGMAISAPSHPTDRPAREIIEEVCKILESRS